MELGNGRKLKKAGTGRRGRGEARGIQKTNTKGTTHNGGKRDRKV